MIQILHGDATEKLRTLPEESVNCIITSPPYWGLRDYGTPEQLGLETTPEEYVSNLVSVFREVKRVLRKDGTFWLVIGDTYKSSGATRHKGYADAKYPEGRNGNHLEPQGLPHPILKRKDLCLIPQRTVIALQEDGWYVRSDIIYHKINAMPHPVTDRPVTAHEYVFLLTKSPKYFYDWDAVLVPYTDEGETWGCERLTGKGDSAFDSATGQQRYRRRLSRPNPKGRHLRTVWSLRTKPFKVTNTTGDFAGLEDSKTRHFATFPEDLVKPMILAGCPLGGTVLDCFAGSGTTGKVAKDLGREAILIEANPEYVEIMRKRLP